MLLAAALAAVLNEPWQCMLAQQGSQSLSAGDTSASNQSELHGEVVSAKQSNERSDGSFNGVVVRSAEKKHATEPVKAVPYNSGPPTSGLQIAVGSGGSFQRSQVRSQGRRSKPHNGQFITNPNQNQRPTTNPNFTH